MSEFFEEGEMYQNSTYENYLLVYYAQKSSKAIKISGIWIDKESMETMKPVVLTIKPNTIKDWKIVND